MIFESKELLGPPQNEEENFFLISRISLKEESDYPRGPYEGNIILHLNGTIKKYLPTI